MSKLSYIAFSALLTGASLPAFAMDPMMDMKAMDTNGDGMISKTEYMKHHEAMWAKMKKNSSGSVSMKDMQMMMSGGDMAGGEKMKDGAMMKDGSMKKDGTMTKDGGMMKEKGK